MRCALSPVRGLILIDRNPWGQRPETLCLQHRHGQLQRSGHYSQHCLGWRGQVCKTLALLVPASVSMSNMMIFLRSVLAAVSAMVTCTESLLGPLKRARNLASPDTPPVSPPARWKMDSQRLVCVYEFYLVYLNIFGQPFDLHDVLCRFSCLQWLRPLCRSLFPQGLRTVCPACHSALPHPQYPVSSTQVNSVFTFILYFFYIAHL